MIWDSTWAMTAVDLLIMGAVCYSLVYSVQATKRNPTRRTRYGFAAIILGLLVVALFYLADLIAMHVFPLFMPRATAMGFMRDLRLDYQWLVALLGVGAISLGLALASQGIFSLIERLEGSETSPKRELAARRRSEVALRESGAVLAKAQRIAKTGNWRWSIERKELVSCSEEFARIHGVFMNEIHDLMKQEIERVIHPEDRARVAAEFAWVDSGGHRHRNRMPDRTAGRRGRHDRRDVSR